MNCFPCQNMIFENRYFYDRVFFFSSINTKEKKEFKNLAKMGSLRNWDGGGNSLQDMCYQLGQGTIEEAHKHQRKAKVSNYNFLCEQSVLTTNTAFKDF